MALYGDWRNGRVSICRFFFFGGGRPTGGRGDPPGGKSNLRTCTQQRVSRMPTHAREKREFEISRSNFKFRMGETFFSPFFFFVCAGKRKCVNFGHVLEGGIERGDGRQVSKSPPGIYFGYLCITQGTPKSVRALIFRPSSLIFARVVAKEKCLLVYPFTRFAEGIFDPPLWGN